MVGEFLVVRLVDMRFGKHFFFLVHAFWKGESTFSAVAMLVSRTYVYVRIHDHLREVDDQHHNVCISQVSQRSLWHVIE